MEDVGKRRSVNGDSEIWGSVGVGLGQVLERAQEVSHPTEGLAPDAVTRHNDPG